MVSLKDIAERCGVSVATVSKALNGQQDIGEATRKRIRETADEMGYLANASARALKTNRTYNIGVLFVDEMNSGLAHEYFSAVLESLKSEAENHGYDITFINRRVGTRTTTYLQHCQYRNVDGVVIACVDFDDPQVAELVNGDLPVVTIDHVFNNRAAVVSENTAGMEELVRYVLSRGMRRIAYIHGEKTSVTENRLKGFYRAMEEAGAAVDEELLIAGRYHDPNRCRSAVRELLNKKTEIDCILFPDDFSALGGLQELAEAGIRIPDDISCAGYDGIPLASMITPSLTTVRQDTKALGTKAAKKLIELIEHPKTALAEQIIVPGKLIPGRSVR